MKKALKHIDDNVFAWGFFVSSGAVIASLILSNVYEFVPCELCWYQRILMFPIPIILGVAILRQDKFAYTYVLPLSIIGSIIALYQSLLQWDIIQENSLTCSLTSGSCAEPEVLLFGFLTIPFGAFLSFMVISILMIRAKNKDTDVAVTKIGQTQLSKLILLVGFLSAIALGMISFLR